MKNRTLTPPYSTGEMEYFLLDFDKVLCVNDFLSLGLKDVYSIKLNFYLYPYKNNL